MQRLHLIGRTFGRLTVVSSGTAAEAGYHYLCRCQCGTFTTVASKELVRGHVQSCGCLKGNKVHGHSPRGGSSAIYNAWKNMRARCERRSHEQFASYGGRGIQVCAQWSASFVAFLKDMKESWYPGRTLDRLDNDGPYNRQNCAWRSMTEQNYNRRAYGSGKMEIPF